MITTTRRRGNPSLYSRLVANDLLTFCFSSSGDEAELLERLRQTQGHIVAAVPIDEQERRPHGRRGDDGDDSSSSSTFLQKQHEQKRRRRQRRRLLFVVLLLAVVLVVIVGVTVPLTANRSSQDTESSLQNQSSSTSNTSIIPPTQSPVAEGNNTNTRTAPTTAPGPTGPVCFQDTSELKKAVEGYRRHNGSSTSDVAIMYGHPIGTWCIDNLESLEAVFRDSTMFNDDISGWVSL